MSGSPEILLAFDFGPRRTGVALGNGLTRTARPLAVIDDVTQAGRFAAVGRLIEQWQPQRLVVGVPRAPQDEPDAFAGNAAERPAAGLLMTERCAKFARQLAGRFGLPVSTVDERFTSRAAAGSAGGGPDDAHAAALILEQWFHDGA